MNEAVLPTTDLERARHDLDHAGYCIIENIIPEGLLGRTRTRVDSQASAERAADLAFFQDGHTQWIANVLNKGSEFAELLVCAEESHDLVRHVLGRDYILSCSNAPIAGPGTQRMGMHTDQHWTPGIPREPLHYQRLGEMRFDNMQATTKPLAQEFLFPPCMTTLMWTLTDFTSANGATVFVPGSHLSGSQPVFDAPFEQAVAAEASAGSLILWDGRTWHATGSNSTTDEYRIGVTNNFVAPMIRPLVNYPYSLRPEVAANLSEWQKQLLGFTTWTSYGNEGVPSQHLSYFKPAKEQTGPLG
ncbi:MAG: phytanoyl-CoA dioxygenase family protein [bacterium]